MFYSSICSLFLLLLEGEGVQRTDEGGLSLNLTPKRSEFRTGYEDREAALIGKTTA